MANIIESPTDAIYMDLNLTEEDRDMTKSFYTANKDKYMKNRKENLFTPLEDKEFLDSVDLAIKAILQHNINKRTRRI